MLGEIIAIYAITDDLLKAIRHQEDLRVQLSDAEVMTTALVAARFFGGNHQNVQDYLKEHGLMPKMLSYSRFNRRWHRLLLPLLDLFDCLGMVLKSVHSSTEYLLDSFPVPVCDNIRNAAYTNYQAEDDLEQTDAITLQAARKRNSKRPDSPALTYIKQTTRHFIETVFSAITAQFPKAIHAVTMDGFLLKVSTFIIGFTLKAAFID